MEDEEDCVRDMLDDLEVDQNFYGSDSDDEDGMWDVGFWDMKV
jgi:hypothetical protein